MDHRTGPELKRLALLPLFAFLALLPGALHAPVAAAEVVENPDPDLIARWEPCEPAPGPGAGVTIVVDQQDRLGAEKVYVGCAEGPQPNGWVALQEAGFEVVGVGGGTGFVCRIDGQPTPAEQTCTVTPGIGHYWSYWHGKPGGRWGYSGVGAANPLSAAGLDAVQGWSFGGGNAPRIEPMNGGGPSGFLLPPPQESSTIPAARARAWLPGALNETAALAASGELSNPNLKRLLMAATALADAGLDSAELGPLAEWLEEDCDDEEPPFSGCALLRSYAGPDLPSGSQFAERFAVAVLGVDALGGDPHDFAGMDLRGAFLGMIEEGTGKVRNQGNFVDGPEPLAFAVEALARTGPLPAKALETVALLLGKQKVEGAFGAGGTLIQTKAIKALAAARDAGVAGLDDALAQAGAHLEGWQEEDGSVRLNAGSGPTFERTAVGAVGLALAGRDEAAEAAARWLSRYQVTAEYVGAPDPVTWEPPPGAAVLGAFLPTVDALRNAINIGIPSPHEEAQEPTAQALAALVTAGPYGSFHATPDQESLWFGTQEIGSQSVPQAVTLTNHDVRSISIDGAELIGGEAADFTVDAAGCAGQTLDPGESCQLSARFAPTAEGTREAVLRATLDGVDQTIDVPLAGIAAAAPDPDPGTPDPDPDPGQPDQPQGPADPGQPGDPQPKAQLKGGIVAAPRGAQAVDGRRRARIATLSCSQGDPCRIAAPKRVWIRIAGVRYALAVLAPKTVGAGKRAALRVRLPKAAADRLRGRRAIVSVEVTISRPGEKTTRTVRVAIGGGPR